MASDSDEDEEWKYSIDEVGEDAEDDGLLEGDDESDDGLLDPEGEGEDGETPEEDSETYRRIEPGSMNPENVLFVVLGVLLAIGTIAYGLGIL